MTSRARLLALACLLLAASRVAAGCGFPGSPAHSSVTFSTAVVEAGTTATYSCDRGFELLGPARRVCQANGTWTPAGIPFCVINVAAGKAPMQSTTHQDGIPQKAVDGSTSGLFSSQTCTMTQPEATPLWYVNLLEPFMIQLVRIDFGQACCEHNLPATVVVRVGNNRPDLLTNPICNRYTGVIEEGRPLFLPCNPPMPGAFVSVHLEGLGQKRLSICETFVYTDQALPVERCPQFRDQPLGASATYNGRCYSFYNQQPRSFGRAQEFCAAREGTLIAETSPALQGFLSWELWRRHRSEPEGQYWLGAVRDPHRPSIWTWITGQQVTVSFWSVPERVAAGDCARMDATKDWLWSAADCRQRLNFVCQNEPVTCGRPEQPPDSVMTGTEFGTGARVTYRCEPGHLLVGPEERECLPTGFYSGYPPTCKRLQCGLPADIEHGSYRFQNGSRAYLSTVVYSCEPGYTLVGRAELICDVDERWNGPPPRCQAIRCGAPPAILNGGFRSLSNATTVGSVVEYHCLDERFELVGPALLRCGANGQYDSEPPVCRVPDASSTTAATAAPFDLSFLDEALAASASEIHEEHTIDLGGLLELLGTGADLLGPGGHPEQAAGGAGPAGEEQGDHGDPSQPVQQPDSGIEARIDEIPLGPRGNATGPADAVATTEREYASETAAAHLAAATDLSFAYQPTEGSSAPAFDISIHYRPAPKSGSSAPPPLPTDPHRRGRPLPTRPSQFTPWNSAGHSAATSRPVLSGDDWSEKTPAWSPRPPRVTISVSDLPSRPGAGDPPTRPAFDRDRPRPTPAVTPGGFFRVAAPEELPRRPAESAEPPQSDPYPSHRSRYRPVTSRADLPVLADDGLYGLRRRFRPISLADIAASEFAAGDRQANRRKTLHSEELVVTERTPIERVSPVEPRPPASPERVPERAPSRPRGPVSAPTESDPETASSRVPDVQFTLMPPSFWPDLQPAQSDGSQAEGVSPAPFRPVRLPPPADGDGAADLSVDPAVQYDSEDAKYIDTESIDRSVRADLVPPTIVWEPARTSVPPSEPPPPPTQPPPPPQTPSPTTPSLQPTPAPTPSAPPRPSPPVPARPSEPPPVAAAAPTSTGRPAVPGPAPTDAREPDAYDRPEEGREPDTVSVRQNSRPGVRLPDVGEDEREPRGATDAATPRLNLSGIIALGVFGGFVFLTAVLTSIVIIVRRTQQRSRRRSGTRRHHYISSSYSTDSESHGLSRHSRRGGGGGWAHGRPAGRRSSSQGYRDSAEVAVADVSHMFRSGGDKRRHHHHHHHRHHHHGDERPRRH
ncbi:uncharacterized protein LOC122375741 isoform X1 [Amphibalanus amphitrite]|uniref:uncharacterized protein LOC122375741 isoform X1 n=1 Tax=Amphibalanus amphitrite TaxID=1232801 RepID=UPI001C8FBAC0|nr:uncharacterized protein LOC122375741 isoform X1 [Amphibalanus amphitrite]